MKTTKYAVVTQSQQWKKIRRTHYGFGQTIEEAAWVAKIAGANRSDQVLAYLYIGEPNELKKVRVTSYGNIENPQSVICWRLAIGLRDSSVKLRNLL